MNLQCTVRFLEADSSVPLSIVNLFTTEHLMMVCPFLAVIVYVSAVDTPIVSSTDQRYRFAGFPCVEVQVAV